jgi:hypothetical protein
MVGPTNQYEESGADIVPVKNLTPPIEEPSKYQHRRESGHEVFHAAGSSRFRCSRLCAIVSRLEAARFA